MGKTYKMAARFAGRCVTCKQSFAAGAPIVFDSTSHACTHQTCPAKPVAVSPEQAIGLAFRPKGEDKFFKRGHVVVAARGRKCPRNVPGVVLTVREVGFRPAGHVSTITDYKAMVLLVDGSKHWTSTRNLEHLELDADAKADLFVAWQQDQSEYQAFKAAELAARVAWAESLQPR